MFCSECGHEINDREELFCPECGTRIEWEPEEEAPVQAEAAPVVETPIETPAEAEVKGRAEDEITGIIFTNLDLLAKHLSESSANLREILEVFIREKKKFGVNYRLVDAGSYTYRKRGFLGKTKTVHLNLDSSLWDYMDILMDAHDKDAEEIEYMFIVGGDEVIPMPCIRHYVPGADDDDIDTDMIYGYPYGPDMAEDIASQKFFTYEPLYHVGRLPLPTDAEASMLVDYLARALEYSEGVPVDKAYGQCDPHWKKVSTLVSSDLTQCGLFRQLRLPEDFYYRGLILSPMITANNVDRVFSDDASLYYFNLHGGDAYDDCGYYGQPMTGGPCLPAIMPYNIHSCRVPNIVFSEACYGGRFIDLDMEHSMMMSGIFGNSLAYVGSSRIAWGEVDRSDSVNISCADILAIMFFNGILRGGTVAEALYLARAELLNSRTLGDPHVAASAVEFNLYGDPSIKLLVAEEGKVAKAGHKGMDATLVNKGSKIGCTVKKVSETGEMSILEMTRNAVDANIRQMHSMIDKYLYTNYNITPRQLDGIFSVDYANGEKGFIFNYDVDGSREMPCKVTVISDKAGEVQSVLARK